MAKGFEYYLNQTKGGAGAAPSAGNGTAGRKNKEASFQNYLKTVNERPYAQTIGRGLGLYEHTYPYAKAMGKTPGPYESVLNDPMRITQAEYDAQKKTLSEQLQQIQMQGHQTQMAMEGYMTYEDQQRLKAQQEEQRQQATAIQQQLDALDRQFSASMYESAYEKMQPETKTGVDQMGALLAEQREIDNRRRRNANNPIGGAQIMEDTRRYTEISQQIKEIRGQLAAQGFSEKEIESLINQSVRNYNAAETKELQESVYARALGRTGAGNLFARTGNAVASGIGALDIAAQNLMAGTDAITGLREQVDYNTVYQQFQHRGTAVAQAHNENIVANANRKYGEGTKAAETAIKASTFANDILVSMGQSAAAVGLTAMGVPGATLLLGASAATSTMHQYHEMGYSDGQALAMGLVAGAAETITEKIGIDNLFALKELKGLTGKALATAVWKNLKSQAKSEAVEEGLSNIFNTIADAIILGDENTFRKDVEALVAQGVDRDEAEKQVLLNWVKGLASDMIAGGISGLLFGGAQAPMSVLSRNLDAEIAAGAETDIQEAVEAAVEAVVQENEKETRTPGTKKYAEEILASPERRAQFEAESKIKLTGTKAEQRRQIREYYKNKTVEAQAAAQEAQTKDAAKSAPTQNEAQTGVQAAQESANAQQPTQQQQQQQKTKRGEIINETGRELKNLNKQQRAGLNAASVLSRILGNRVHVYESTTDTAGNMVMPQGIRQISAGKAAPNGFYDPKTGDIYIDLNAGDSGAGTIAYTLAHEYTHFMKQFSAEKFDALASFLEENWGGETMADRVRAQQEKARANGGELSEEAAKEEVIADAMEAILTDTDAVEKLEQMREADPTLFEKFMELVRKLLTNLKEAYGDIDPDSEEGKIVKGMQDKLEEIAQLYAEGLDEAGRKYEESIKVEEVSAEPVEVTEAVKNSYRSLAKAAGFTAVENEDGSRAWVRDNDIVTEVTVEDIEKSPIGNFINFSLEEKDITKEEADAQKKLFAEICTMAAQTNEFSMAMQFAGSAVFTGIKSNADKQYGTTYDFPSICTKTQAVIDGMSKAMVAAGRGLTTEEIEYVYRKVFHEGNPVPCPECYVFSRWIGIGSLLDNISKYQQRYGSMTAEEVQDAYAEMEKKIEAAAEEAGLTKGKAKGKLASEYTKKYNKLKEEIEKADNQGEKVSQEKRDTLASLEAQMDNVKAMTWIHTVYFANESHTKVNPRWKVPADVLFDLNNGETFATQYKEAWGFRTTQGAGYGKAITPYAEAELGEGILGTNSVNKLAKDKKAGKVVNPFLKQEWTEADKKTLRRARAKQKNQAFIGGQRFQSTSDARFENASDYLLAALEMQAMHGMVQAYTKVPGAVPAFAAWGFSTNQSLMPKGTGLDENGNPIDTSVGGMDPGVAKENREKWDTQGTITIGVNDNHIRKIIRQGWRDFVIPYHASGGKANVVNEFRKIQDQGRVSNKTSTDYSKTQSEKELSDIVLAWMGKTDAEIEQIHKNRAARIAILTGAKNIDMETVRNNKFLSDLYDKLNGGEWDGVKVAKGVVAGSIFPNEYWDTELSYEESGKIVEDYLEYCDDLGFLHKFSGTVPRDGQLKTIRGYDENGERVDLTDLAYEYEDGKKTDRVSQFYWKLLTDRRMYDNQGAYLPQQLVKLSATTPETVTEFAKTGNYGVRAGRQYNAETAEKTAGEAAERIRDNTWQEENEQLKELNEVKLSARGGKKVEVNPNPWREAERFSENWAAERARDEEIQELMEADPVGVLQEGIRITQAQLGAAQGDRAKKLQNRLARLEQAEAYYAYAAETGKQVSTTENTQRVRDLRWAAEHIVDGRRKRRERSKGPDDDAPKAEYTRGEWEAEQDRRSSYETEEAPPERESVYDEEAQAFADEWARERLEQQRESEYEEAVDQAKERVLSGKKGHMTGRDGVKKTVSIRQNNRGQWFGEIKTGKSTQDTRRYKTKEEAAEAVISKAETGDETGVNSSIPENPVNKEPRTVEETRRETDERVREKAEEVLGEDPVVNGREMSPLEEKEVKDMISEHGDMLDDDAEASAELAWATEIVSGKGGNYADTLGRNLDAAAGKNKALREKLHQLIEIPLRKAKESYAKGLGGKRNALYDEIVEGLGIKPGSKESAAVQWYGEGQRNTESGDRSVLEVGGRKISVANKVAVEYTLEDLKRDFPNKWKDIVKAEQWFRRQYDEYVERINVSLEKVYPKVEEKARVELAKLKANAQYNAEQAKASEETVQQLEWKIGKERSKRSGGKKGKLLRWEKKLAEAKKAAERYREKQTRCQDAAVKLQKDIDSGEILRNKRLTPRKDYFHHMQESREGWGRLIDILTAPENISSDLSGQSEFTKPNAKFAGFMQRRTGDLAKQDAVEGFLHYIEAAEYKIAFDPFVAEGRRQIKSMAEQTANTRNANKFLVWYTDYLNGIAGKTNPFDRWMSKAFDRKSVEALKWLNSRVKANAIMGNVRSALAQFFNLQNGALYMPNPAHWAKGAKLLAEQIVGKSDAKTLFDRSVFLNERFLDNKMWRFDESIMKNPNRFANWMMSAGDELSAKLIWATAYEKAAAAKMTDPIEYADDITMRSVGGRGVGDVPLTQSSEVVKLIAPFQLEVNNSWQAMKENFKAKNGAGFVAMAVVSFAMNEALRQTLGYDVSFDMINALIEGIKGWDDEEEKWDNLMNVFGRLTGEIVSNIPMGAQIAQLLWSDEASRERFLGDADPTRFGTGNIGLDMVTSVVTEMVAGNNFADDLLSATLNLVLPWGGKQTEKIVEALQDFGVLPRVSASMRDGISVDKQAEPGSYSQSGRLRFPIEATAGNVMRDLLFGPYSTKQGIEFSESGEFALSEDLTAAWEALTELGMDGVEAYDAIRESRGFTADKDETGKSIAGSKKNKVLEYINGLDITEEQKDILLASAGYDDEKAAEAAPWNNDMENDEFRVWADLTTWEQEDYEEFVEGAGMSLNDYAAFCEATRDMTADKDENGKSISGTKKKKIVDYIQSLDIPAEQKDALFFAAGYKESTLDETPWHDGEETEAKKKKSGKRGGRRRTGREKALSIKSIAEDLGLEDAIRGVPSPGKSGEYASAYEDIQKVTGQIREKNPWWALPTGNPELDEERPAAARYFETGRL